MGTIVAIYLLMLALGLLVMMVAEFATGKEDLLTVRNFFLAGFIVFQLTSCAIPLIQNNTGQYAFSDFAGTSFVYAIWVTVFLLVFLGCYKAGWFAKSAARATPTVRGEPAEPTLWLFVFILLAAGAALRFGVNVPLIGVIAGFVGVAFAAIAAGIAAWIWARRPLNPAAIGILVFVSLAAVFVAVIGSFGRRPLVAVGACILWGAYFSRWRYSAPTPLLTKLAVLGLPLVMVLALFSTVRGENRRQDLNIGSMTRVILSGDMVYGALLLVDGQGTGYKSVWLMENYPENFEYDHFLMARYFFYFPIPRDMWKGKPEPLSQRVVRQARLRGVNRNALTIGPGIIGHCAVDGGFIVVIFYAAGLGLAIRYFDQIVKINPYQPFAVLPIGSTLGQVLGMPRGETSVFAATYVISVAGSYAALIFIAKLLEIAGLVSTASIDEGEDGAYADGYADDPEATDYEGHQRSA